MPQIEIIDSDVEEIGSDVGRKTRSGDLSRKPRTKPPVRDIQWRSFSGSQNENVTAFVQHVHQTAFTYGCSNDEEWTAQYAIGCLTDSALLWACELDEQIQRSWSRLRPELLRRYASPSPPVIAPGQADQSGPSSSRTQEVVPAVASPLSNAIPDHPSTRARRGRIEVIDDHDGRIMGFLNTENGGTITSTRDRATIVEIPSLSYDNPFHMLIVQQPIEGQSFLNMLPHRDFPYLGVKVEPQNEPPMGSRKKRRLTQQQSQVSYPQQMRQGQSNFGMPNYTTPTWVFRDCARSRQGDRVYKRRSSVLGEEDATASAEVWKVCKLVGGSEELRIFWMETDLTTLELGVYCQYGKLVLRDISRPTGPPSQSPALNLATGQVIENTRVQLTFQPINPSEHGALDVGFR